MIFLRSLEPPEKSHSGTGCSTTHNTPHLIEPVMQRPLLYETRECKTGDEPTSHAWHSTKAWEGVLTDMGWEVAIE